YAELLDDTAVALAPVDATQAEELIRSLRGSGIPVRPRGPPALGGAARLGAPGRRTGAAARGRGGGGRGGRCALAPRGVPSRPRRDRDQPAARDPRWSTCPRC